MGAALHLEDAFRVGCETDRFWCACEARRFARNLGFDERAQWELAIVVAELVSNAVRYAGSGTVTLRTAPGSRTGMEIVVADRGAGAEPSGAGHASPGPGEPRGLGLGLKTVRCLSDAVSIEPGEDGGMVVTASRYLAP